MATKKKDKPEELTPEEVAALKAEYDEAIFDAVIGVNVKGVFLGLRHVLPEMIRQGGGSVVNTASVAGLVGTPGMPAYVASKHAVIAAWLDASGYAPGEVLMIGDTAHDREFAADLGL